MTAVVMLMLLLGACGGSKAHTITGHVGTSSFSDANNPHFSAPCVADDGTEDITRGAVVTVKNAKGETIATGTLAAGRASHVNKVGTPEGDFRSWSCSYAFSVSDVPDSKFYEISVAHRSGVTFSKAELEKSSWRADLKLGD